MWKAKVIYTDMLEFFALLAIPQTIPQIKKKVMTTLLKELYV